MLKAGGWHLKNRVAKRKLICENYTSIALLKESCKILAQILQRGMAKLRKRNLVNTKQIFEVTGQLYKPNLWLERHSADIHNSQICVSNNVRPKTEIPKVQFLKTCLIVFLRQNFSNLARFARYINRWHVFLLMSLEGICRLQTRLQSSQSMYYYFFMLVTDVGT